MSELLEYHPYKRITLAEALNHPWFKTKIGDEPKEVIEGNEISESLGRLKDFKAESDFKRAALNVFV